MVQIACIGELDAEVRDALTGAGHGLVDAHQAAVAVLAPGASAPKGTPWIRATDSATTLASLAAFAASPTDEAVLDPSKLQDLAGTFGQGPSFVNFLDVYIKEGSIHVDTMEQAAERGDLNALGMAAHSLKPASGMLGAAALHGACRQLELDCREGVVPGAPGRAAAIRAHFHRVREALEHHIAEVRV